MSGYDSIPIAGLHGTTVYVHVCLACGALVLDRHRHDPHHAATRTTPPDPHTAGQRRTTQEESN